MKILMLNYEFPPLGGGAGRATLNISRELVKLGHEVDIITSGYKKFKKFEKINGANVYKVKTHRKSIHEVGYLAMLEYVIKGWFLYRKLIKQNKYDVIHSFFSIPSGIIPYLGKILYKKDYIVSLRGTDVPGYDKTQFQLVQRLLEPLNIKIWKNAKSVVTLSSGLTALAKKSLEINYKTVYNGIDTQVFKFMNLPKKHKKFGLVTVSRLLKRKGIHHVLEALKELNDDQITLDIYGMGNYESELKTQVINLNLGKQVFFREYVENQKLYKTLNKHDAFILPSLTESFGLVLLEAMACGLPVIASSVGGIPEIVEDGINGVLVEPGNVSQIKEAIMKLKENPKLREKMQKANLKRVKTHFTWESVAKKYLKIYNQVIKT